MTTRLEDLEAVAAVLKELLFDDAMAHVEIPWSAADKVLKCKAALDAAEANAARRAAEVPCRRCNGQGYYCVVDPVLGKSWTETCDHEPDGAGGEGGRR